MEARGLGVEFVAPQEFSSKEWWLPLRPGLRWFYHTPRAAQTSSSTQLLTETLDEELVPLVKAVRAYGLDTEASCAGHAVSSAYTKRLYAALRRDAQRVATKGLKLMNVETRQVVDWQDADYKLPWADWHVLDGHLQDHSLIGMITIVGPQDKLHAVCQSLQSVPQVTAVPGPGKLQLWVTEATAAAQSRAWKIAAKAVLHGCA